MRFGIVVLAAAALLLVGCAPQPDATPTPSATALPFATDEEAFAAAEATYRAYVDALNQVDLQDPATFEAVYAWTTDDALAGERKSLSSMHAEQLSLSGTAVVLRVSPKLISENLVEVYGCLDVSRVGVHNISGESQVGPDRPDIQAVIVHLTGATSATQLRISDLLGSGHSC
jgi:hypothetical protein